MTADGEFAVSARSVSKQYRIGVSRRGSLYDRVARRTTDDAGTTIWALRDVTFDVKRGEVLGFLGRNGSGKSTLMKIIARVTSPTRGQVTTFGRIAALLQAGAGFHPELTGRDNIWLCGTILGMSRQEIDAVADQIIEFADIPGFLDTPVKHYSGGMHMRLAFSVSAHMTADIMLIDEVLSVGDAAFQRKCQLRIRELVRAGRTVLFVSHSMASVRELCDRAIVLERGRLLFDGITDAAVAYYEQNVLRNRPTGADHATTRDRAHIQDRSGLDRSAP